MIDDCWRSTNICNNGVGVVKEWADRFSVSSVVLSPKDRTKKVVVELSRVNFSVVECSSICHRNTGRVTQCIRRHMAYLSVLVEGLPVPETNIVDCLKRETCRKKQTRTSFA